MEYIIGSGAILETGPSGGITPASLHANVAAPAATVAAAAFDFEGSTPLDVRRMLVVAIGASPAEVRASIEAPLRVRGECSLADVLLTLARAARTSTVHLFAHWLPDESTCAELAAQGVEVISHPVESVRAASVVSGQRYRRVA